MTTLSETIIPNGLLTADNTETITNKTISGLNNTITDVGLTFFTEAQNTTFPNDTAYANVFSAVGSTTDVDFVIDAKGVGALLVVLPDGSATGGNKRGDYAIDFQKIRTLNSQVASGSYSTIVGGRSNSVSGSYAVSGGYSNNVSALGSTAFGYSNTVNASYASALGYSNIAQGLGSISLGYDNASTGNYGVSAGYINSASSDYTVAIGYSNLASNLGAVSLGYDNTASSTYSTAFGGRVNSATNNYATTAGYTNTAGGAYAIAIGYSNDATGTGDTALGYNNTVSGGSAFAVCQGNSVTGAGAAGLNLSNLADGRACTVLGENGDARRRIASLTIGSVPYNTSYAMQSVFMTLGAYSTSNTGNALKTYVSAGLGQGYIDMDINTSATFKMLVVAQVIGGDAKAWEVVGLVRRGASGASYFVGTPTPTVVAEDVGASSWTIDFGFHATYGYWYPIGYGQVSTNIYWTASVWMSEVGN